MLVFHATQVVYALSFEYPQEKAQVIGELQWTQSLPGDKFSSIGRRYGIGYHEILEANPGITSDCLEPGTIIVLPNYFVLPAVPQKGVVINLAELRLYYYGEKRIYAYPIGIGRAGWDTPVGLSYVLKKLENPVWHVPKSIQVASEEEGLILPDKVLPGADNPLGMYALRLHYHNYLIHGTNEAEGVGRRSTAGCIRMFPEDIKELFAMLSEGTLVNIVNDPYKFGWDGRGRLHLEAHLPLKMTDVDSRKVRTKVNRLVEQALGTQKVSVDWEAVQKVLRENKGVPIAVGALQNE